MKLCWLLLILACRLPAADFGEAVAAYRGGRPAEAMAAFAFLAEAEPDPARRAILHANAGTAAARAEQLGEAVWHLETALRLLPRDAVAARNLEHVRARLGQGATEAEPFTATLRRLPLLLTPEETTLALSALAALGLLLVAAWRGRLLGASAAWTGAALVALGLVAGLLCATARAADLRRTVVIETLVSVRAEPDEDAPVLFRLGAGTLVREEDERHGWRLVESGAGGRGWAPADAVRPLGG